RLAVDERHLADDLSGPARCDDVLDFAHAPRHLHVAGEHHVEAVADVAFMEQFAARGEFELIGSGEQLGEIGVIECSEQWDAAQVAEARGEVDGGFSSRVGTASTMTARSLALGCHPVPARCRCTACTAMAPSPTADAMRLTERCRTS